MFNFFKLEKKLLCLSFGLFCAITLFAQKQNSRFKVIAFYTAKNDLAHISFVHEANKWFPKMGEKYQFHVRFN